MKEYYVQLPIAGVVSVTVEADTEEEAIQAALSTGWTLEELDKGKGKMQLEELDLYEHALQGNVCYLPIWEASAEEE